MKKLSIFIGALFLLFLIGPFMEDVEMKGVSEFEAIAVHEMVVNSDVDEKEFEAFIVNEIAPIYNKMEGQTLTLVKGDRGIRTNKYAIILTFDSIEDRDRIYPPSGEFVGDFGGDSIWNKFNSMVDEGLGKNHTDYVEVGP